MTTSDTSTADTDTAEQPQSADAAAPAQAASPAPPGAAPGSSGGESAGVQALLVAGLALLVGIILGVGVGASVAADDHSHEPHPGVVAVPFERGVPDDDGVRSERHRGPVDDGFRMPPPGAVGPDGEQGQPLPSEPRGDIADRGGDADGVPPGGADQGAQPAPGAQSGASLGGSGPRG